MNGWVLVTTNRGVGRKREGVVLCMRVCTYCAVPIRCMSYIQLDGILCLECTRTVRCMGSSVAT